MPRRRPVNLALGLALTGLVVAVGLLSLAWTPYPPEAIAIANKLQGPSAAHWLGTDQFGRDVAAMVMVGARNSLSVAVVAVGLGALAGIPLGLIAAMRRGWLDDVIGRFVDLGFAFPAILTAILVAALAGPGPETPIIAIAVFNAAVFARVARGLALHVLGRDFIRAALALGRSRGEVALFHVLPNMAGGLVVQATIQLAVAILAEAALSYLGLGLQPPAPSWGKMLFEAQTFMFLEPSQAIFPGLAIAITVLGLNLLGDGLRDLLDPRLKVLGLG